MVAACLGLAGCQAVDDAPDACGAERYGSLIGTPVAAVTLPADLDFRIIGPDDVVTMDYDPTRLNLRTDAGGTIVAVDCG
jgi:hypothetical protein